MDHYRTVHTAVEGTRGKRTGICQAGGCHERRMGCAADRATGHMYDISSMACQPRGGGRSRRPVTDGCRYCLSGTAPAPGHEWQQAHTHYHQGARMWRGGGASAAMAVGVVVRVEPSSVRVGRPPDM